MPKTFSSQRFLILKIVVIVLLLMKIEAFAGKGWEVINEIPTKKVEFATAVVDGKIYLIGGTHFENRRGGPFGLSTVEAYDPQTNTWQKGAEMPTPRASAGTAVVNGRIYVFGGYRGIDNRGENLEYLDVVEAYAPQTNTWIRKQEMSLPRKQFGTGVVDSKIYTIGGSVHPWDKPEGPWRINLVEAYNPATDTWTKRAKMPTKRSGLKVEVVSNRIYAIGGYGWPQVGNQGGPRLKVIEAYTPKLNRWRKKKEMPELRTLFSTVVVGTDIYLIGGWVLEQNGLPEYLATVAVYTPATEKWREETPLPMPLIPAGAATANGKIYVLGGERDNGAFSPEVLVFDTGFWAVTAQGKLPVRWGALKMERQSRP